MRTLTPCLYLIIAVLWFAQSVLAERVYKWTDENGAVHYSNKAGSPEAKVAKLPEITRGDYKVVPPKIPTCQNHGGIDCEAGPDSDGSVICQDGFTEALTRFAFNCKSPKLGIADVTDINPEGGFSVFVRNTKSVAALNPALFLKLESGPEIKLAGPEQIEPYGIGEFLFTPKDDQVVTTKPTIANLQLTCANCP